MFRPDQPFVTIITALTRARLSLCALCLWRRLSLLGGDEVPAVMRFFGDSAYPARHRKLMVGRGIFSSCAGRRVLKFDEVLKRMTNDGTRALVRELPSRDKGK